VGALDGPVDMRVDVHPQSAPPIASAIAAIPAEVEVIMGRSVSGAGASTAIARGCPVPPVVGGA